MPERPKRGTPEYRAMMSAAIKAMWRNPVVKARRTEAARKAWDKRRAEGRDKITVSPEDRQRRVKQLDRLRRNSEIEARRVAGMRVAVRRPEHIAKLKMIARAQGPDNRLKAAREKNAQLRKEGKLTKPAKWSKLRKLRMQIWWEKRRGYRVPPHLKKQYELLGKYHGAREAARMMGLLPRSMQQPAEQSHEISPAL